MSIRIAIKKFFIWSFIAAILGGGFLSAILQKTPSAQAANISFKTPGKWYQDGNTGDIYNEISMLQDGVSSTIKWGYSPEGSGVIFYKPYGGDNKPIENVTRFRLSQPRDMLSTANVISYYLFVANGRAIDIGYKLDKNDLSREDFLWGSSLQALEHDISIGESFTKAKGGANTPLGGYLSEIGDYIRLNKPAISLQTSTGPTAEAKKACEDKLIGPLNKNPGGNPLQSVFKAINDKLGMQVISPISDAEDLGLYYKFFKTTDSRDYSDTYIDTTTTATYKNFVNEFQLTETGLAWFWTDKTVSTEKNGLYTLIAAATVLKAGGGVLTLAPAAVGAVATLGVDYYKANVNKNQWPTLARLLTAKVYLDAHMQYDRCIATTDQSFKDKLDKEEKNFKQIMGLISQQVADYIEAQNQANTGIGGDTCGLPNIKAYTSEFWIAKALCGILGIIADLSEMLINGLFKTVFNAYHPPNNLKLSSLDLKLSFLTTGFSISTAHAATDAADNEVSPLNQAFTNSPSNKWGWVIPVWKFVLGLTDLFLVVILLFLGVVNILHIQYDTYAIKKMLPLLIIGVILANFSLVIMRMLIDASNVLTTSFMGGPNPGDAVHSLILNFGLSKSQLPSFAIGWKTVGGLFLSLFFSIFVIAAFLILGVMFYIRYAAIILLGIAAPLAFICLAFPPTQSVFKQWWSWTTKFVFMKPIAMFFIMVAIKIKESGGGASLTGWIIITALVYMAIIVPWKLGGAVMAMWGGAMGTLFGTKKGGWARKPVEEWGDRRKKKAGAFIRKTIPGLFSGAEADRKTIEAMEKTAQNKVAQNAREKHPEITAAEQEALGSEHNLNTAIEEQLSKFNKGELELGIIGRLTISGLKWQGGRPRFATPLEMAQNVKSAEAKLNLAKLDRETNDKELISGLITQMGRDDKQITNQLRQMAGMTRMQLNDDGTSEEITPEILSIREMTARQAEAMQKWQEEPEGEKKENYLDSYQRLGLMIADYERANPNVSPDEKLFDAREHEIQLNDKGTLQKDHFTYRDARNMAAEAYQKAITAKDPETQRNFYESAKKLENQAQEYAKAHPVDIQGNPINYQAYMDQRYSGRIMSALTADLEDEIKTNEMNENSETMLERFLTRHGFKNTRGTMETLKRMMKGDYDHLDPEQARAAAVELKTWAEFIGRKGGKDRGRFFANLMELVDTNKYGNNKQGEGVFGAEGILMKSIIDKIEDMRPGTTADFMAEAMKDAHRRGYELSGTEAFKGEVFTTGKALADRAKQLGVNLTDILKSHPEIFRQIDLTPAPQNRAKIVFMNEAADLIGELDNFCAAGNIIGYTLKVGSKKIREGHPEDYFGNALKVGRAPSQDYLRRREESRREEERIDHLESQFANTPADELERMSHGPLQAIGRFSDALVSLQGKLNRLGGMFKIDGAEINESVLNDALKIMASSSAKTVGGLLEEIRMKLGQPNITIDPNVDLDIDASSYLQDAQKIQKSTQNIDYLRDRYEEAEAKDIVRYTHISGETKESLEHTAKQLESVSELLAGELAKPTQNPNVIDKVLETVGDKLDVVPLTREKLKDNPTILADYLQKMARGARTAASIQGSLTEEGLLRQLIHEVRKNNETITNMLAYKPSISTPQTPPTQPPAAGAATPKTPTPPTTPLPTPPPPSAPAAPAGPDEDLPESIP